MIRISFSDGHLRSRDELDGHIRNLLSAHREEQGLPAFAGPDTTDIPGDFADLIRRTHLQAGAPVVVLIDEYDKPILDNITDRSTAQALRDGLRNLYSVLKGADPYLKFVFLTGVSKFSKVSLFSGLNNLTDITVEPAYSALCGYTDEDVDTVFAPELPGLDREEIRRWYNGYNWGGTSVYNPFDVLLLFRKRVFRSYWFETATPTFLINLLADRQYFTPDLGRLQSDHALLSSFDVDRIEPEALRRGDVAALEPLVKALFASIPHDWYRNNPLAKFEGHYASVFYSYFAALGLDIRLEDTTNHGRIDMAVLFRGRVFVFEFKVVADEATGEALQQIKAKGYAEKYLGRGEPVHLIGVEFSRATRNVVGFEAETLA